MGSPGNRHSAATELAYIGLGSNVGDREAHLRFAIARLAGLGAVRAVSSLYETEPVGTVPQPDFMNAVAQLETALDPEELLTRLLAIERAAGRNRDTTPTKGPRTLDLDLLTYGMLEWSTTRLTLPHPELAGRSFVLIPLAEIAPAWRHPVSGLGAEELLAGLAIEQSGRRVRRVSLQARDPLMKLH